jgi:2'-5' RNA ligase
LPLRLFVAIDLDQPARQAVGALQQRIAKTLSNSRALKWVRPEHMHLTLAFLGEVAAPDDVTRVVEAMSRQLGAVRFAAGLERLGVFPSRGAPRVLWLGVGEGESRIVEARREVVGRLTPVGFQDDPRPFHPHLTLARWRESRASDAGRALAADPRREIASIAVDHITLYESRLGSSGPTYTELARATLT